MSHVKMAGSHKAKYRLQKQLEGNVTSAGQVALLLVFIGPDISWSTSHHRIWSKSQLWQGTAAGIERLIGLQLVTWSPGLACSTAYKLTVTCLISLSSKWFVVHYKLCEISGSHGDEYEHDCLLGCCLVKVYRRFRGAYCLHHQGERSNFSE
jgi:hypothetical protein